MSEGEAVSEGSDNGPREVVSSAVASPSAGGGAVVAPIATPADGRLVP